MFYSPSSLFGSSCDWIVLDNGWSWGTSRHTFIHGWSLWSGPIIILWRGYGLSSQLFAMIWLPLALAFSFKYFSDASKKSLFFAVVFVTCTTAGHLGIGMITMLSIGFLAIGTPISKFMQQNSPKEIFTTLRDSLVRLTLVAGISIFLLSYWIIPTFIHGNFHNMSFWDPVWKFDS